MSALDSLQVGSGLSYLVAFVVPALDAILPALPGETAIVALGVATGECHDGASGAGRLSFSRVR